MRMSVGLYMAYSDPLRPAEACLVKDCRAFFLERGQEEFWQPALLCLLPQPVSLRNLTLHYWKQLCSQEGDTAKLNSQQFFIYW